MTKEEHKKRHEELHKALDELVADMMSHTRKGLSETSVMELIKWSHSQMVEPNEPEAIWRGR